MIILVLVVVYCSIDYCGAMAMIKEKKEPKNKIK
jgi:hypothetical protein